MGVNTTGLLNTQTEVYASYKNDAVTKNETAAKKDSTAKTEEKNADRKPSLPNVP